jgi:hypothetical protein
MMMSTASTWCHIHQPKPGESVRLVNDGAVNDCFFVIGCVRGIDPSTLIGEIEVATGRWVAGTLVAPPPAGSPPNWWAFKFQRIPPGTYRVRVYEPGAHLQGRHADLTSVDLSRPTYDPVTISTPAPNGGNLDVCPIFSATGSISNGTAVTVTLSEIGGGQVAQVGATLYGSLWIANFNVSEGNNRQLDAENEFHEAAGTQKTINNTNTAC